MGETAGEIRRRRRAVLAGHQGDEGAARALLAAPEAAVRAAALGALARMGRATADDVAHALADPDPTVRRRACEAAAPAPAPGAGAGAANVDLRPLLADPAPAVVEAAAWALGERGEGGAELAQVATQHADPLCREAAVAALGAIGDPAGLPAILAATRDRPAIRRRAVIALAPFAGPEVDEALHRAAVDRDWQVRQAAEDLGGGPTGPPSP